MVCWPDIKHNFITLPAITGLRGFAAMWVVLYHLWADAGKPEYHVSIINLTHLFRGWVGVDIFFVLSGFSLFVSLAKQLDGVNNHNWRKFFLNLINRIVPAYNLVLGFLAMLISLGVYPSNASYKDFLYHLFFIQNLKLGESSSLLGVLWTLAVEWNFYLLLPLIFYIIRRFGWGFAMLGGILLSIIYRILMFSQVANLPVATKMLALEQLPGRLSEFMLGIGIAILFVKIKSATQIKSSKFEKILLPVGIFSIYCWLALIHDVVGSQQYWNGHPLLYFANILMGISCAMLVFSAALDGVWVRRIFANYFMQKIGLISYGVYLWHELIHQLYLFYAKGLSIFAQYIILLAPTVLVAWVSYRFVEYPLMRWVRKN